MPLQFFACLSRTWLCVSFFGWSVIAAAGETAPAVNDGKTVPAANEVNNTTTDESELTLLRNVVIPDPHYGHVKSVGACYYCFDKLRNNMGLASTADQLDEADAEDDDDDDDVNTRTEKRAPVFDGATSQESNSKSDESSKTAYRYSSNVMRYAFSKKQLLPFFYGLSTDRWTRYRRRLNKLHCPPYVLQALQLFRNTTDFFLDLGGDLGDCSAAAFWRKLVRRGTVNVDGRVAAVRAWKATAGAFAGTGSSLRSSGQSTDEVQLPVSLQPSHQIWKRPLFQSSTLEQKISTTSLSQPDVESHEDESRAFFQKRASAWKTGWTAARGAAETPEMHSVASSAQDEDRWWSYSVRARSSSSSDADNLPFLLAGGAFVLGPGSAVGTLRRFPESGESCGGFTEAYCKGDNACGETANRFVGTCPVERWQVCSRDAGGGGRGNKATTVDRKTLLDEDDDCIEVGSVKSVVDKVMVAAARLEQPNPKSIGSSTSYFGLRVKLTGSDVWPVIRDIPDEFLNCKGASSSDSPAAGSARTSSSQFSSHSSAVSQPCIRWFSLEDVFTVSTADAKQFIHKLFVQHDFAMVRFRTQRESTVMSLPCVPFHDWKRCNVRDVLAINCAPAAENIVDNAHEEAAVAVDKSWHLAASLSKLLSPEEHAATNRTALEKLVYRKNIRRKQGQKPDAASASFTLNEAKAIAFTKQCLQNFPQLKALQKLDPSGIRSYVSEIS
ncbi:unnamed protein product, partial [Amoebophrya sp. A120]|eukprot:GSA120T00017346001.1